MKIHRLEISHIRGIKQAVLVPAGENLLLYGPNGAGKSAAVDAIDLLLTGNISRLTGRGTGSIHPREVGRHVDAPLHLASVRASVSIAPGSEHTVITRHLGNPSRPEVSGPGKHDVERVLRVTVESHHMLSRSHLLSFIAAEPQTRGERISRLLDLAVVERQRKAIAGAARRAKQAKEDALARSKRWRETICSTLSIDAYSEDSCVVRVNEDRRMLACPPLPSLLVDDISSGVTFTPPLGDPGYVDPDSVARTCESIESMITALRHTIPTLCDGLSRAIADIESDARLAYLLKRLQLFRVGVDLIPETGECPLCDTSWPPGELEQHLRRHLESAERSNEAREGLRRLATAAADQLRPIVVRWNALSDAAGKLNLSSERKALVAWLSDLDGHLAALDTSEALLTDHRSRLAAIREIPSQAAEPLAHARAIVDAAARKYPDSSRRQAAFARLTTANANLKALRASEGERHRAAGLADALDAVEKSFETARSEVFEGLYREIEQRFNEFYRFLHHEDEADFEGMLSQTKAGIDMRVTFYGRGPYAPTAVHSEGHQDSMGLCLFLALSEKLANDRFKILVLDDVVMSVDAGHRRAVCDLLKKEFADWQLIVTTHDRLWARQLRNARVVRRRNSLEFSGWKIETGPIVSVEAELWQRIAEDLEDNDVATASQRLRRSAEEFFETACDHLRAPIPYRSENDYTLGDFVHAAQERLRQLARSAAKVAKEWNRPEKLREIESFGERLRGTLERTEAEKWLINKGVHFSRWDQLSVADFTPIVDAWRDLFYLFACEECGEILRVIEVSGRLASLRCGCERFTWNLVHPRAASENRGTAPIRVGADQRSGRELSREEKPSVPPAASKGEEKPPPPRSVGRNGQIRLFE